MKERLITDQYDGYEFAYPEILELSDRQLKDNFWLSTEYDVGLDRLELRYDLAEGESHYVLRTLPLFIKYEMFVGSFWSDVYPKLFKAPECQELASVINMIERAVHSRFYRQLSEALELDNDAHFMDYLNHPELKSRTDKLKSWLSGEDKLNVCLAYSAVEGVFLFANFLGLRSFQMNGNNKIPVIVRGTIQSSVDEDLHSQALVTSINIMYRELGSSLSEDVGRLQNFKELLADGYVHECLIIDSTVPEGGLNGITRDEYKDYVAHRINLLLARYGCDKLFPDVSSRIGTEFESGIKGFKMADFFTVGAGSEYQDDTGAFEFEQALLRMESVDG